MKNHRIKSALDSSGNGRMLLRILCVILCYQSQVECITLNVLDYRQDTTEGHALNPATNFLRIEWPSSLINSQNTEKTSSSEESENPQLVNFQHQGRFNNQKWFIDKDNVSNFLSKSIGKNHEKSTTWKHSPVDEWKSIGFDAVNWSGANNNIMKNDDGDYLLQTNDSLRNHRPESLRTRPLSLIKTQLSQNKRPWSQSKRPWSISKRPWSISKKPWSVSKRPWSVSKRPWSVSKRPWSVSKRPWSRTE